MDISVRAFKAISEPDTCRRFKEGHLNVLRDYGITNVTSNTNEWMFSPDMYCVVAESGSDNQLLGGIRLQVSRIDAMLPVETAIGQADKNIFKLIRTYRESGGVAEMCALWNAKAVAGLGISRLLIRAGVASAKCLPVKTLISICADYTLQMFRNAGFVEVEFLKRPEGYPYPNRSYVARVLALNDLPALAEADPVDRERILSLIKAPRQSCSENEKGRSTNINYSLVLTD